MGSPFLKRETQKGYCCCYPINWCFFVVDFQPAVITPTTDLSNRSALQMFAHFADTDGGILL